jgi:transposase
MSRVRKDPLRQLSDEEREMLKRVAGASSERVDRARRAKALLAVADGRSYIEAASDAGLKCNDAVSQLVGRFNQMGLSALDYHHAGGPGKKYDEADRERILLEFKREPDPRKDGTKTWSLTLLQRALRSAEDGLPEVSTYTILNVLHEAGYTWQRSRTWCSTGSAQRKRKGEVVTVTDPEAEEKRGD